MASSLKIIGNHSIEFDNPKNVIKQVEDLLGIQVIDGSYNTINAQPNTSNLSEA